MPLMPVTLVNAAGAGSFARGADVNIGSANTDLAWINGTALSSIVEATTVGGSLRSLGAPTGGSGTRYILRHGTGSGTVTIKHATAGGSGVQFFCNVDLILNPGDTAEFVYDATFPYWILSNLDRATPATAYTGYTTSAYRNTNQALANGSWNQINLDNETRDDGGWHDNATNNYRITPTVAGVYVASARVVAGGMTGGGTCEFRITVYNSGGAAVDSYMAYDADLNNLNRILSVCGIYPVLAVGDYFVAEFQGGASGSAGNVTVCNLTVALLRTP